MTFAEKTSNKNQDLDSVKDILTKLRDEATTFAPFSLSRGGYNSNNRFLEWKILE